MVYGWHESGCVKIASKGLGAKTRQGVADYEKWIETF